MGDAGDVRPPLPSPNEQTYQADGANAEDYRSGDDQNMDDRADSRHDGLGDRRGGEQDEHDLAETGGAVAVGVGVVRIPMTVLLGTAGSGGLPRADPEHEPVEGAGAAAPDAAAAFTSGQPWAAPGAALMGLITVSWVLCDCPPGATSGGAAGHMAEFCNAAPGCRSVRYRPRHRPGT